LIVADANLIVALVLKSDASAKATAVWAKDREWIAPLIWESEARNAVLKFVRAGVLTRATGEDALTQMAARVEGYSVGARAVLRLAMDNGLTAYDAEYAALAERFGISAVSLDPDLTTPGLAQTPDAFLAS
jgi:predicted nucleic acid-binding protein